MTTNNSMRVKAGSPPRSDFTEANEGNKENRLAGGAGDATFFVSFVAFCRGSLGLLSPFRGFDFRPRRRAPQVRNAIE